MGEDDRSGWKYSRRYALRYVSRLGGVIIVLGGFAVIAPFLPANNPQQESTNPWVLVPIGLVLIVSGAGLLAHLKRRTGAIWGHMPDEARDE